LLTLDHHKAGPYENLFTDLDTGLGGPEIWASGGPPGVGRHTAAGGTFWNIRGRKEPGLPPEGWGPPGLVFVGLKGTLRKSEQRDGWHYESIPAGALTPPNLHLAQLERRLTANKPAAVAAGKPARAPSELLVWTTGAGQAFKAKFAGLSGANVIFELADGRRASYPLASLAPQSRTLALKLAGAAP
jgi:hypothetical protein